MQADSDTLAACEFVCDSPFVEASSELAEYARPTFTPRRYQGAEASHARVSVFVPGAGWMSFDPTNDVMPGEGHITLAWGRDYGDVTPLKGITLGGGRHTVEVEVRVTPADWDSSEPKS